MSPRVRRHYPTARQAEFLLAYVRAETRLGFPPSFRDIADEMGGISPSAVFGFAVELESKGYVDRSRGRLARGLSLTGAGRDFVLLATSPEPNRAFPPGEKR